MQVGEKKQEEGVVNNVTEFAKARIRRAKYRIEAERIKTDIDMLEIEPDRSVVEIIELASILPRAAALPVTWDTEIAEAICKRFALHPSQARDFKDDIRRLRNEAGDTSSLRKQKIRAAKREDYFDLFETILGPLKRDIFTKLLMRRDEYSGFWVPAINDLEVVQSEAAVLEDDGSCRFQRGIFKAHFKAYEQSKTPELICEVPEWDQRDRIKEIAAALVLDGSQEGFTPAVVEDILKAWLAGVFRRMENPRFQNPALILVGPRKIGKDYVTDVITDGFGQWAKHLEMTGNHKDDYGQLSRALVLRISEFDKLTQTNNAKLKDLIWRPMTSLRKAYAYEETDMAPRCSFIASTNNHDIYKDPSGHRQYWPLNLASISRGYPDTAEDSRQVAAQAKALGSNGYSTSEETDRVMAAFLEQETPEAIEAVLAEHWEERVTAFLASGNMPQVATEIRKRGWVTCAEARESGLFLELMKHHGITERYLCNKLSQAKLKRRDMTAKGYALTRGAEGSSVINGGTVSSSVSENDLIF